MSSSILVAYATKYGSTQEVAEAVAETLRESGAEAVLYPAREVRSLEGHYAVVLGAPLYMFRWHKDSARGFLSRHRAALAERPVAIFALGPFNNVEEEFESARSQLDKELANFPWLAPVAKTIFGGAFDPAKLTFPFNLIPAMKHLPANDIRDWEAIRAWARRVAAEFPPRIG